MLAERPLEKPDFLVYCLLSGPFGIKMVCLTCAHGRWTLMAHGIYPLQCSSIEKRLDGAPAPAGSRPFRDRQLVLVQTCSSMAHPTITNSLCFPGGRRSKSQREKMSASGLFGPPAVATPLFVPSGMRLATRPSVMQLTGPQLRNRSSKSKRVALG